VPTFNEFKKYSMWWKKARGLNC